MRLACPNCDARYEVPDEAIPEGGRDVQCSNCGHAWFQLPAASEDEADPLDLAPELPEPEAVPEPEPEAELEPEAPPPSPPPASPLAAEGGRATLDQSVLSILREEAEREADARRQESQRSALRRAEAEGQFQTQPELGLPPAPGPTATERRLSTLRGEDPDAPPATPPRPTARRDLLPNVDDINSTLQPEDDTAERDVDALPDLTRGPAFRSGFLLAVFLVVVAGVVYVAAPSIGAMVPALKGPVDAYVGFVDGLRTRLDGLMDSAAQRLNGEAD